MGFRDLELLFLKQLIVLHLHDSVLIFNFILFSLVAFLILGFSELITSLTKKIRFFFIFEIFFYTFLQKSSTSLKFRFLTFLVLDSEKYVSYHSQDHHIIKSLRQRMEDAVQRFQIHNSTNCFTRLI